MSNPNAYLVSGRRTPVGRYGGALSSVRPDDLAALTIKAVVEQSGIDPAVVVWVPDTVTTSTDKSRATLPDMVSRADAVFNIGRAALFVAACASGFTMLGTIDG